MNKQTPAVQRLASIVLSFFRRWKHWPLIFWGVRIVIPPASRKKKAWRSAKSAERLTDRTRWILKKSRRNTSENYAAATPKRRIIWRSKESGGCLNKDARRKKKLPRYEDAVTEQKTCLNTSKITNKEKKKCERHGGGSMARIVNVGTNSLYQAAKNLWKRGEITDTQMTEITRRWKANSCPDEVFLWWKTPRFQRSNPSSAASAKRTPCASRSAMFAGTGKAASSSRTNTTAWSQKKNCQAGLKTRRNYRVKRKNETTIIR